VQLNGSTSVDPDGTIKRYIWKMIQSPGGGWIEDPSAASTYCHYLSQGTYLFELEVVDDRASWSKDTIKVTVNPSSMNIPPVAAAGKDSITTALVYNMDATSSFDPDGYVAGYSWQEISGPSSAIITCASCVTTNITNLANGIYKMEVTVTDNLGAKTKDTVQIIETGSALPAGILYVKGKNADKSNILQWATVSEYKTDHFEIQRSIDGRVFTTIGSIPASGISTKTKEYSYTDEHAPENISYYRLMQVDQDGSFKYSAIVVINNNQGKWIIETYPNPVAEEILVHVNSTENGKMNLQVVNEHGQVLRSMQVEKYAGEADERINVKGMPAGIYFLEIRIGDTMKEIRKIVKK
jgi:hypothetical protein